MTDSHRAKKRKSEPKKWTGKHVLIATVAFFAVIIAVNMTMVTLGLMTFPGEDTKQSYRQGLEYDNTLAERNQQLASGWTADISFTKGGDLVLKITDADKVNVKGLKVEGTLKHLAKTELDVALKFAQSAEGTYITSIDPKYFDQEWILVTTAQKSDGTSFKTRNKLWLKQPQ